MLDYRLVDEELPQLVEQPLDFGQRLLAGLSGALPELTAPAAPVQADLAESCRREVERAINAAAAAGDAVIVGRSASAVLGPRVDVLRVFIHAPLDWRVAHVSVSLGCDAGRARAEIARIDAARRGYARAWYRLAWGDPHQYDLTVDTSRYGVDGAAEIVAAAWRAAGGTR